MSPGKGFNLDDYIDVAERIRIFREQYPDGSLQSRVIRWPFEGPIEQALQFVAVEARAYRTPDDERPGFGLAWEPFPGRTPYTKDSELMVAETSAWGRAIVAVLAADTKRGVASKNEVDNRRTWKDVEEEIADGSTEGEAVGSPVMGDGGGGPAAPASDKASEEQLNRIRKRFSTAAARTVAVKRLTSKTVLEDLTRDEAEAVLTS